MRQLPLILAILVPSCLAPTVSEAQTANNFTVTSFSASPTRVQPGGVLQLAATVTSSRAVGNYTVGFVAYVNNQAVWGQFFPNLVSTTGGSVTETYNLPIPTSASSGSYQFVVGVWSPNWVWYTGASTTVTVGSAPPAPVNTALPVINGTPQVGWVLSSSTGTWTGATSFAYQWAGNGTPITGAAGSTYTPAASDVGHTLTVAVTATGTGGTATATSAATAPVASSTAPVNLQLPVISGTAQVGTVLSSSTGTWTGATSFAYQWAGNGTLIAGATASTYTPAVSDVGHTLTVAVTATGSGGMATATSVATAPVASAHGGTTATSSSTGAGVPQYTCVTNVYVSPSGNDSNPGTLAAPLLNPQTADATVKPSGWTGSWSNSGATSLFPGVCINFMPGTYSMSSDFYMELGGTNNSATGYAVVRSVDANGNYSPGTAHFVATSTNVYYFLKYENSYQIVDGLDINGGGLAQVCTGNVSETTNAANHHLVNENNTIHGCTGIGVYFSYNEYIWVIGNTVYGNNLTNSQFWDSGIEIYEPADEATVDNGSASNPNYPAFSANSADTALTYHIVVANNIVYGNGTTSSCGGVNGCGEIGINILTFNNKDKWPTSYSGCGGATGCGYNKVYPYNTLIVGNYVYNNGSNGILYAYGSSAHTTIANNTTHNNNIDTTLAYGITGPVIRAELLNTNSASANAAWVNNIAYAVPGSTPKFCYDNTDGAGPTFNNNITYNGTGGSGCTTGTVTGSGNQLGVNPLLTNPAGAVYTLQSGSPAIDTGLPEGFLLSSTPNIGAFQ